MRYYKFPKWLKRFYPDAIWDFSISEGQDSPKNTNPTLYLTFDDGPNPGTTEWLLQLLDEYKAKATFFCIGDNVKNNPELYAGLIKEGHQIGNHSFHHLNGLQTKTKAYVADVQNAALHIDSMLFRPPYGKMKTKQYKKLTALGFKTVFWSHITYDFDATLSSEKRIETALNGSKAGDIIVFHDSDKAFPQLKNDLPILLKRWTKAGFKFNAIKSESLDR